MIFRIILILIVPLLSIIFSLMSSGIENIITSDNKDWETIPIYYWIIFWTCVWFSVYKFKFQNTKKLKIWILRLVITVRMRFLHLDFVDNSTQLNDVQKRALDVWKKLLDDQKSDIACCMLTNRRMVSKNGVTVIISAQNDANCLFVHKTAKSQSYHDIWLPNSIIAEMYKSFDKEQKNRFQKTVDLARREITAAISL